MKKIWKTEPVRGKKLDEITQSLYDILEWCNRTPNAEVQDVQFGECYDYGAPNCKGVMALVVYTIAIEEEQ